MNSNKRKRQLDPIARQAKKSKTSNVEKDQKQLSNMDKAKCNGILRKFIGFVQDGNPELNECSVKDCATFLNWLSSENIDVYKENWDVIEAEKLQPPQNLSKRKYHKMPSYWALSLSKMLPILLKCDGKIDFVNEKGKTILHIFLEDYAKNQDLSSRKKFTARIQQMIQYLMDKGISVDAADQNGNTSMHFAAKYVDLLEIMLKNCVNINACNEEGNSILHIMAMEASVSTRKSVQLFRLMLSKGADVNLQNRNKWTPVHFAAKNNLEQILILFIKNGADLKLCTNDGKNLLLLFCKHQPSIITSNECMLKRKSVNLAELLIEGGCDVNVTDENGYSPLHYISKYYITRDTMVVMDENARMHCKTDEFSIMETLGNHGDICTTRALVVAGANVNAKAADGVTPLQLAASTCYNVTEHLIECGADVHCREKLFGFTLTHMAAFQRDKNTLHIILSQKLNVNDGGKYGITALHLASFLGNIKLVEKLIEHGANVHCQDTVTHSTPLHFASKGGEMLDFISSIGDVKCKPFWTSHGRTQRDTEGAIALLVESGADINAKDASGRTALHLATAYTETKEMVWRCSPNYFNSHENDPIKKLLQCGAYTDVQDNEGNLPLHNALRIGHEKALDNLLDFNVDVNEDDTSRIVLNCKEDRKNQVLNHLVKQRAAKLPVSSVYIPYIDNLEFQSHYRQCLIEVEKLKTHLINDAASLYDLLHMNWRQRLHFIKKFPKNLEKNYPLYNGIIQSSCREALQRKSLLENAKLGWYQITEVNLPDVCVEHIFDYLKNRYLRVLADGIANDRV